MEVWTRVISLSIGGVLGVNARYWLGVWMSRWTAAPWATFTINMSGSFAIGFLSMTLARWLPHPHVRLLILTGFLGGYTTFSTWAFESAVLWDRGEKNLALVNLFGSLVVGMAAALAGMALARDVVIPARERAAVAERPSTIEAAPSKERP
ncbi:fluoride efflux transporter CrcB [Paludisphaera borealis]|uniref:Fluoride-specific ion channel FluC n=1 Tax=Paludisphaera borealis TaxID=1387353 RepID=A0A1U7CVK3_9BACT|nr:fluoride efflux transporter CrcB [Paludisphaera borealis]APW62974.1 Putative fluoride ion transporter CrcB [Paludisphaera borealis]